MEASRVCGMVLLIAFPIGATIARSVFGPLCLRIDLSAGQGKISRSISRDFSVAKSRETRCDRDDTRKRNGLEYAGLGIRRIGGNAARVAGMSAGARLTKIIPARSSLVRLKNQPTRICAGLAYTTISFAGSLQAPMTPLRPQVRTRTQMTVPGVKPPRFALPPLNMPAGFQSLSVFGSPVLVWTSLMLC